MSEEGKANCDARCDIGVPADKAIDWRDVHVLCNYRLAGL